MFSANSRKISIVLFVFGIFLAACNFRGKSENPTPVPLPAPVDETRSVPPFSIREPEKYQAEIITQIFTNGEKEQRKTISAHSGQRRLTIFNAGEKTEVASLILDDGRSFTICKAQKVYAPNQTGQNVSTNSENDFLTTEWLNAKSFATFENLGTENNLTKFRVRINDSQNAEILIYVDENLKFPVKQEFYEVEGDEKNLTYLVEIKNFTTEVDEKIFELPPDYRQITAPQLQDILWREKLKGND